MDQLCFAPVGLAAFFTYITLAEGGGKKGILKKLDHIYIPALYVPPHLVYLYRLPGQES